MSQGNKHAAMQQLQPFRLWIALAATRHFRDSPPMKIIQQSPTDPSFVQNPYPTYDAMRAHGPFVRWADYDLVCTTTLAVTSAVLRDKRLGRQVPEELAPPPDAARAAFDGIEAHSMLELEGPDHTRLRGLVLRSFTSRGIAALADGIRALCHNLIDQFPEGDFDLLDAYARPVPVITIARLLGVPEAAADDLLRWSNAMVAMYQARLTPDIVAEAETATLDFSAFIREHLARRSVSPGDDLISTLLAAGDKISEAEMISTCILLLNAGHEATVHTLGNGVKAMLEAGIRRADLAAVEEIMRLDPPLHMFTRWVMEDCEIAGQMFKRGEQIGCLLGAANRDPGIWDQPEVFNPDRAGPAHVAFGGGAHFCVGAPLARMELQIALEVLWERCPALELVGVPIYADVFHFHGLERLMVTGGSDKSI
jgi:cytochrome P450